MRVCSTPPRPRGCSRTSPPFGAAERPPAGRESWGGGPRLHLGGQTGRALTASAALSFSSIHPHVPCEPVSGCLLQGMTWWQGPPGPIWSPLCLLARVGQHDGSLAPLTPAWSSA